MRIPKGGVAFFDSGIGGLTVLAECRKLLPDVDFYYYGDNGHAPYGNLPEKKIRRYVLRVFQRFKRWKVGAAVVACNTATALCVEELREKYPFPIVGAEPAVFAAATSGGEIFVLSTRATYESERFQTLCKRAEARFPAATLKPFPCDGLAGEIEKRLGDERADFTASLPVGTPRAVVLGCTHYVYVAEQIARFYRCPTVDGNRGIARRLKSVWVARKREGNRPPATTLTTRDPPPARKGRKSGTKGKGKRQNPQKNTPPQTGRVFFLGGHANRNKAVYERMFG